MQILQNQNKKKMPKITGRVCTRCNRRSSAPCDGFNKSCKWYNTYNAGTSLGVLALLLALLFVVLSCSTDDPFDQVEPEIIPGYLTIDYAVQNTPTFTVAGYKLGEKFFAPTCTNDVRQDKDFTRHVIEFVAAPNAAQEYPKCE